MAPRRRPTVPSDGKVFIGGSFDTYGGLEGDHLVLVNADGTTDLGFDAGETINIPT